VPDGVLRGHVLGKGDLTMVAMIFQAPGVRGVLGSPLLMMLIVMGIFYVMLILPQQRQRKKMQQMLEAIKAGDKVITNGGIYGTVAGIDGDTLVLKVSAEPPVKIRVARSAIAQVEALEDAK